MVNRNSMTENKEKGRINPESEGRQIQKGNTFSNAFLDIRTHTQACLLVEQQTSSRGKYKIVCIE